MTANTIRRFLFILPISVAALMLAACTAPQTAAPQNQPGTGDSGKINTVVSIVPQKYFVERIGGDHVTVSVMVEPGNNPATYEPKPAQLKALSQAEAYFSIGVPFENAWLGKISQANPDMEVVDTIAGIERLPMETHDRHDKEGSHHEEHEHAAGSPDPHVWLSPKLVKIQSQIIYETLVDLDPAHQDVYKANLDAFAADIDALESDIQATLSNLDSNKFLVFHPAWGYFASDFGLEQIPVELGGQEPSAQELAQLIEEAQAEDIRVVFAQPEFSTQDAETIAQEIGGKVLLINPLAPDWLENLRQVSQSFAQVLNQ